jgi:hypothetical protein
MTSRPTTIAMMKNRLPGFFCVGGNCFKIGTWEFRYEIGKFPKHY